MVPIDFDDQTLMVHGLVPNTVFVENNSTYSAQYMSASCVVSAAPFHCFCQMCVCCTTGSPCTSQVWTGFEQQNGIRELGTWTANKKRERIARNLQIIAPASASTPAAAKQTAQTATQAAPPAQPISATQYRLISSQREQVRSCSSSRLQNKSQQTGTPKDLRTCMSCLAAGVQ